MSANGRGARTPMDQDVTRQTWRALFGRVAETDRVADDLRSIARYAATTPGQILVTEDQPARDLVALAHGEAAVGVLVDAETRDGFVPERGLVAPCWIDASSAWRDGHHLRAAQATTVGQVVRFPVADLRRLIGRHPPLGNHLLQLLAAEIGRLSTDVHDLMQKDAEARLASWLVRRIEGESAATPGAPPDEIHLTERKRQIATQLGVKPETLSRLLRALNRKGLVEVFGYRVRVLDADGLRQLAAG
jgi:CRP-like cAMP-binding protein